MAQHRILHTAVIGAGQAGLAAGYYLRQRNLDCILLDANKRIGDSWRKRWDGLKLFSPQRYNSLPGKAPAGDPKHLPDHQELADYLEEYARHWRIPVRNNTIVTKCVPPKGEEVFWTIISNGEAVFARHLIVASGAYRTPNVPGVVAETFPSSIQQLHSSEIQTVAGLTDENTDVLILGAGASGRQLSRQFYDTGARVILAGPKVTNLPRRFLGKDIYWWLYRSGMMTLRTNGFPGKLLAGNTGGDLTVGEAVLPENDRFQRIATELTAYRDGRLEFDCKKTMPEPLPWAHDGRKRLVIWCSGYRNAYPFLPSAALNDEGLPVHTDGKNPALPGLFFLGLPNLTRPNSSLVGGVGRDAERIVKSLG